MDEDEARRPRRWLIWLDQLFFVTGGANRRVAGLAHLSIRCDPRLAAAVADRVLGDGRLPRAATPAPDPHLDLSSRLLHRRTPPPTACSVTRSIWRFAAVKPRCIRRWWRRAGPGLTSSTWRPGWDRGQHSSAAQLPVCSGELAVPVPAAPGLHLPAGGRRFAFAAAPRPVLEVPGRLAVARRRAVDWLAAGTYDRSVGLRCSLSRSPTRSTPRSTWSVTTSSPLCSAQNQR